MGFFFGKKSKQAQVELRDEHLEAVLSVVAVHGAMSHPNVAFDESVKQSVDIVGESNYQDTLKAFLAEQWATGILLPEPENPYDPNAVALHLINAEGWIDKVGYLPRPVAARTCIPISNLLATQMRLLVVRAKLMGGTPDFPNIGVKAWVKSDEVDFH